MVLRTVRNWCVFGLAVLGIAGCGSESPSFSILPDTETFQQSTESIDTKIDILWVVDNSGSMQTSQSQLAANFQAFIQDFETKNFDFQMAVTTTDAYLAEPEWNTFYGLLSSSLRDDIFNGEPRTDISHFRDGVPGDQHGIYIMNEATSNLTDVFQTSILQQTNGYGDERAFQSLRVALEDPFNSGLVRENSFLAVIIVTDEDDFSHPGFYVNNTDNGFINDNTDPALDPIADSINLLDSVTNSTSTANYSVSSITIKDSTCLADLTDDFPERLVADRVLSLASATGGVQGSLCGDFAQELGLIAEDIITKANTFFLERVPIVSTITVVVNGESIPNTELTAASEGFYFDEDNNAVIFTPGAVPEQGASIAVNFDPVSLDD